MAQLPLDHKADVNVRGPDGMTALIKASWWGNLPIVKLLIDHKADVNATDKNGATALDYANREVASYLNDKKFTSF